VTAPWAAILSCSAGGTTLQLAGFSYDEKPIVDGGGRTGTDVAAELSGWVAGTNQADLAAGLAATIAAVRAADGQDFTVTDLSGNLVWRISAAACREGGPHLDLRVEDQRQANPLRRDLKLSVKAKCGAGGPDPGDGDPDYEEPATDVYRSTLEVGPDGLRTYTRAGEISGPAGAAAALLANTIAAFEAAWPWPNWVRRRRSEQTTDGGVITYSLTARETAAPLKSAPAPGAAKAVEGSTTYRRDRDEQMRLVETFTYDLLIGPEGTPRQIEGAIRPTTATILRESWEEVGISERRIRAEYVVLSAANADDLLDWSQSWSGPGTEAMPEITVIEYADQGHDPVLVWTGKRAMRYTQRGRAVAVGRYLRPAAPLFPGDMEKLPRIERQPINAVERETTWEYQFVFSGGKTISLAALGRPANPAGSPGFEA
jgi:hypothetical protein